NRTGAPEDQRVNPIFTNIDDSDLSSRASLAKLAKRYRSQKIFELGEFSNPLHQPFPFTNETVTCISSFFQSTKPNIAEVACIQLLAHPLKLVGQFWRRLFQCL